MHSYCPASAGLEEGLESENVSAWPGSDCKCETVVKVIDAKSS